LITTSHLSPGRPYSSLFPYTTLFRSISLYNLRPSATIIGLPAHGVSSGQALTLMEEIARRTLPAGTGFEWSAMSYQEKLVGSQIDRKSTRLNSSHGSISYAVFCLKKK